MVFVFNQRLGIFFTQDLPVCDIQPLRNLEETLKAPFRASFLLSGYASIWSVLSCKQHCRDATLKEQDYKLKKSENDVREVRGDEGDLTHQPQVQPYFTVQPGPFHACAETRRRSHTASSSTNSLLPPLLPHSFTVSFNFQMGWCDGVAGWGNGALKHRRSSFPRDAFL